LMIFRAMAKPSPVLLSPPVVLTLARLKG